MHNYSNQNCRVNREEMASLQLDTLMAAELEPTVPVTIQAHKSFCFTQFAVVD